MLVVGSLLEQLTISQVLFQKKESSMKSRWMESENDEIGLFGDSSTENHRFVQIVCRQGSLVLSLGLNLPRLNNGGLTASLNGPSAKQLVRFMWRKC